MCIRETSVFFFGGGGNHSVIDAVGKLWHLSHDIINELLEIMPYQLHRGLLNEIKQAEWLH